MAIFLLTLVSPTRIPDALAQLYCEHLSNSVVGVGEGRVRLNGDSSLTKFANAYHDGSGELSLTASYPIGYLNTNESVDVGVNAYIEDLDADDCDDYTVALYVYSKSGACGKGAYRGFARYKVNTCALSLSCSPAEECFFYGGRFITRQVDESWGNIYYEVEAGTTGGATTLDTGCFNIGSSASACF
ncbi:MAG: hypothetical protein KC549_05165 [Myxococcales bacterium]|nr:hypothetical protein [Myxococcales bacterium]MCB9550114.1 hypothetical protein [Myxococcales bacterium]